MNKAEKQKMQTDLHTAIQKSMDRHIGYSERIRPKVEVLDMHGALIWIRETYGEDIPGSEGWRISFWRRDDGDVDVVGWKGEYQWQVLLVANGPNNMTKEKNYDSE